jgi:hypothetical protein
LFAAAVPVLVAGNPKLKLRTNYRKLDGYDPP